MKTVYEVIWSIVGLILISWFMVNFAYNCHNAAVLPQFDNGPAYYHNNVIDPTHEKQSIEQFLNDHPDIKKRVDELNRQAEHDSQYKRS